MSSRRGFLFGALAAGGAGLLTWPLWSDSGALLDVAEPAPRDVSLRDAVVADLADLLAGAQRDGHDEAAASLREHIAALGVESPTPGTAPEDFRASLSRSATAREYDATAAISVDLAQVLGSVCLSLTQWEETL